MRRQLEGRWGNEKKTKLEATQPEVSLFPQRLGFGGLIKGISSWSLVLKPKLGVEMEMEIETTGGSLKCR